MANYENFDFIDTTAKDNEIAAVNKYAELTGIQLQEADPRRIIFKSVAYMLALAQEVMNDTAKQNFLLFQNVCYSSANGLPVGKPLHEIQS